MLLSHEHPVPTSQPHISVVVITGANSGIGKETARDLAARGAVVILGCRSRQAALQAVRDIRTTTGDGDLIVMDLDLGDLASVRTFATNLLRKFDKIDVLINNAGVYFPPEERRKSKDGFEIHFGVNHLGHFLLTHLLLTTIKSTPGSRIVTVSSSLYVHGRLDYDVLDNAADDNTAATDDSTSTARHNPLYCDSKLANILHSQELARKTQGAGVGVLVVCPGFVYTGLMRYTLHKYNWFKKLCFTPIIFLFMRNSEQGAQSVIHCAVSEELEGIEWAFVRECKIDKLAEVAQDPTAATKLWHISMNMVGEGKVGTAGTEVEKTVGVEVGTASAEVGTAGVEVGTAGVEVGTASGEVGTASGEVGTTGGEVGTAGGKVGTAGVEVGTASGEVGTTGGEVGTAGGKVGTAGGKVGTAGVEVGTASGEVGTTGGEVGTAGGKVGTAGGERESEAVEEYRSSLREAGRTLVESSSLIAMEEEPVDDEGITLDDDEDDVEGSYDVTKDAATSDEEQPSTDEEEGSLDDDKPLLLLQQRTAN
ncbi:retinol dehydrogenase 11 isoform X2 [Cherax quadricarinatus]|uniref:retinol dehydrogenase 11 isoform X2 n=1 Tax=Cherax quadricarinatus TaxID=27406 RepID=UPI00387EC13E